MLRISVAGAALALASASSLRSSGSTFNSGARAQAGCKGTTFDFYELVTQWAPTLCGDGTFPCTGVTTGPWFTLHGLWPQDTDGDYPCTCTQEAFDPSILTPIQSEMDKYWPSLNGPSNTFWEHEWSKHGTCASSFKSQFAFFNSTLSYLHKYDIVSALGAAGISPGSTGFTKTEFGAAMKAAYGQTAWLECDKDGNISGSTFCVTKAGAAMECPANVKPACSATTIYLPTSV